jgi:L-iditol 2-dehydrogenase
MAEQTMKAVYLHGRHDLRVREEPIPKLARPDEALVRIGAVGICGSDCHFYERGRIGRYVVEEPLILGHECSGTVVEVGAEVDNVEPGDRVAIEPGYPCRKCHRCREGRYNLCEREVTFMATPGLIHGAFREYLTWPADFLFKLPESMSLEDGAMVEPLAVGIHACRRGGIAPGQSAAVIGAGPIGLLAAQAAAAYGAHPVMVTDVIAPRVKRARQLGFIAVDAKAEDAIAALRRETNGGGPDAVIETAGTISTMQQAMRAVKTGGVVVLVGLPPEDEATLPIMDLLQREYDIHSVFRYANCYLPALSLIAAGKIALEPLRTHTFDLDHAEEAIQTTIEQKAEAMKVMVRV